MLGHSGPDSGRIGDWRLPGVAAGLVPGKAGGLAAVAGAGFDFVGFRGVAVFTVVGGELFPCLWVIGVDGAGTLQSDGGSLVLVGVVVDDGEFERGLIEGLLPVSALVDEVPHFVEVGGKRTGVLAQRGLEVVGALGGVVGLGC